jgi:hypothetical protein
MKTRKDMLPLVPLTTAVSSRRVQQSALNSKVYDSRFKLRSATSKLLQINSTAFVETTFSSMSEQTAHFQQPHPPKSLRLHAEQTCLILHQQYHHRLEHRSRGAARSRRGGEGASAPHEPEHNACTDVESSTPTLASAHSSRLAAGNFCPQRSPHGRCSAGPSSVTWEGCSGPPSGALCNTTDYNEN